MDITARLSEAKPITALLRAFDDRGLDAYGRVAPALFDSLDQADGAWLSAVNDALGELRALDAAAGRWSNPAKGQQVSQQIAALSATYAKRQAALIDVVAQARETLATLLSLTVPQQSAEIAALHAAGVPQRTVENLYPFALVEHLSAVAQHALHGPHAAEIASVLRASDVLGAHDKFTVQRDGAVVMHSSGAMGTAHALAENYLRATYGPWRQGVSSQYENVVSMWAYELAFFHEVANQRRPAENARTALAQAMKQQRAVVTRLVEILSTSVQPTT